VRVLLKVGHLESNAERALAYSRELRRAIPAIK
jgi:hypothetical protein